MDYQNIINDLSSEQLIQLITSKKIKWTNFDVQLHKNKLESFTKEQLEETQFQNSLTHYSFLESCLKLPPTSSIYQLANEYFISNGLTIVVDCYKGSVGFRSEFLLELYLKKFPFPLQRDELINHISIFNDNTIALLFKEDILKVAQYLNNDKVYSFSFSDNFDKFHIAPLNTLINEDKYNHVSVIKALMHIFPRTIPFSNELAENMVQLERELFLKLPFENQANAKLFNFATNNIIYGDGGWASYDEIDRRNIAMEKIDNHILDYINNDENGLKIALAFLKYEPKNIHHQNIQALINNPLFSEEFAKYKIYLSSEQKTLCGIYTKNNMPLELGELLYYQDDEILADFILKTNHKYEMQLAFYTLLSRDVAFKDIFNKETTSFLINNFDFLLEDINRLNLKELQKITYFILDNNPKDFKNLKIIENNCKKDRIFEQIIMDRLSIEDKLGYLEYNFQPKKKNKR